MAKKHPFLPKLLDKANVAEPKQPGHFEAQTQRIILAISDGIEVDQEAHARAVSSVPDAYARPLTFQSALSNPGHPLRGRVLQEWRGLLSLLALHRIKPDLQRLEFKPVRFNGGRLAVALQNLAPSAVRLQRDPEVEYRWTDFLLIQYEGVTLGAFSPTTLVFTSADYHLKLAAKPFPLKDEQGYLCPPRLSNREDLESVGEWVQWFAKQFAGLANLDEAPGRPEHAIVETLNRELRSWQSDLKRELGQADHELIDAKEYQPSPEPIRVAEAGFLEQRDIYRLLLRPLQRDKAAAGGSMSDYALEVDARRLPDGLEHIVVIDEGLFGQNLKLWQGLKPSELGPNSIRTLFREASGTRINNSDIGKDKGLWIRPELYFLTATLTKAVGSGDFLPGPEARANGGSSRYLLPLRPEVLRFFAVEDVLDKLRPTYQEENDRVIFSISLPLRNGRSLAIKKTYLLKGANAAVGEGALVERPVPVLELFPNYLGEFWARYYLLSSDTEQLQAAPVHGGRNAFYLSAPKVQRADNGTERLRAEITRISGVDCFPEAVSLTERGTQKAVGLVLLERYNGHDEEDKMDGKGFTGSAVFGIDFGTSNTNVFIKRDDEAKPLTLRFSKYLRSLANSPQQQREAVTQAFFIPTRDLTLPTPTALRVHNPSVREDLLLDYFVYFPDQPRYPDNVLVDLKWDQDNRGNLNNFLESLSFLLVLEAVRQRIGRVEFRCTYPKSFSAAREREYRDRWNGALQSIFDAEGVAADLQHGHKLLFGPPEKWSRDRRYITLDTPDSGPFSVATDTFFATEGIAAGEFFSNKITAGIDRASPETGAICIDVGGGTTDFSLLYKGVIKYDASVLLAGKQIANVMARNNRIGQTLLSRDANEALQQAKLPTRFASRMNYILREEHKSIASILARESGSDAIRPLRRVLMVEFGALAFYAGHLTLALNKFLKGELSAKVAMSGLKLHWGGNASKMLDWIDSGKFQADGDGAAKLLNNLFGSVVTHKDLPEAERLALKGSLLGQKQSTGHKNEAAGGVVVMATNPRRADTPADDEDGFDLPDDGPAANPAVLDGIVMGEAITVDGRSYPAHHVFQAADIFGPNGSRYEDSNLEQLDQFLRILNFLGVKYGGLDPSEEIRLTPQDRLSIRNNLRSEYAAQANAEPTERLLEPAFILEVRNLLDIMLERML